MHSAITRMAALVLSLAALLPAINAQEPAVKREMRSAWLATVWQLDWPPNVITETGNESEIKRQQTAMTKMLDSLQVNNFNAVNFQVRSRCDAFYKSKYEPWSTDLVAKRGMDPGWDPLAWVVEECHKRGLECHAWINPYRYSTSISQVPFSGPNDYRTTHPEWLLAVGDADILNPGLPEVRQRICDVTRDIIENYDVDGLLFDDYFYLSGTPASADGDLYKAYKDAGGTLSQMDWRRDNVNQMVADVYRTIQEVKPYVRFGISPAGVCCTSSSMAQKYGVRVCPSGSDWQYGDICSEPLAWMKARSLDYISPQVYWVRGYGAADYSKIVPWWGEIAQKFGPHLYVSHSITSLTARSEMPGMTMRERAQATVPEVTATGPGGDTYQEYIEQVKLNRSSSLDGNFGSIYFSMKYISAISPKFGKALKNSVYTTPALIPAMDWKPANNPGMVTDLTRDGNKLSWTGKDNVRYTVYAVPTAVPLENFQFDAEYLLGTSYATSFTIPDDRLGGFHYGVCVLDRYGNEYSPAFVGRATIDLDAPKLTYPAPGATVEYPFEFKWDTVSGANQYVVEVSTDADFRTRIGSTVATTTSASCVEIPAIPVDTKLYWRVVASGISANDGISESREFTMTRMAITYPAEGEIDVDLTPTVTWSITDRPVTVEIANDKDFEDIIYAAEANGGSHKVAPCQLAGLAPYFIRISYQLAGQHVSTLPVTFTTKEVTAKATTIAYPVDGGEFYANDYIEATPSEGYYQVTFQIDTKEAVGNRFIQETMSTPTWHTRNTAGSMGKTLEVGQVYYMRCRGGYHTSSGNKNTDWSPVISATYKGENVGVETVTVDNTDGSEYFNLQGIRVDAPKSGQLLIRRKGGDTTKVIVR